ncbi:hypothetical protein BC629DRAFT_1610031 [Irpex lacteus]|nr:hypothetical protein BC629DRAFT_1610031 [Irpex lacteus]
MTNVLPGESIPAKHINLKLRPGLLQVSNLWWIESNARRYAPTAQESVVGVVISRSGEGWRVDIGAAHMASLDGTLDGLVFEGATKRNRSNLKVDSVIYAQVSLAHKDMEQELECLDAQTRKAGEFGELKGGLLTRSLHSPFSFTIPIPLFSLNELRQSFGPKPLPPTATGCQVPAGAAIRMNQEAEARYCYRKGYRGCRPGWWEYARAAGEEVLRDTGYMSPDSLHMRRITQSSSATLDRFVGLRLEAEVTLSSSLGGCAPACCIRMLLPLVLSIPVLLLLCSSHLGGLAAGNTTVVRPCSGGFFTFSGELERLIVRSYKVIDWL